MPKPDQDQSGSLRSPTERRALLAAATGAGAAAVLGVPRVAAQPATPATGLVSLSEFGPAANGRDDDFPVFARALESLRGTLRRG